MKKAPNHITIHNDNLSTYGFVCFHRKGEPKILNDTWNREIEISVDSVNGNRSQVFEIPSEFLIEVSDDKKIINAEQYSIRSFSDSLDVVKLLSERAGWNQTNEDLQAMFSLEKDGIYISKYKFGAHNLPLGSGISLPINQDLAWIGMILVHPELRRQGIARSIMNTCLNHARTNQKKKIVGLDATPLGKQVYDSLGFKDSFTIWRSVIYTDQKTNDKLNFEITELDLDKAQWFLTTQNYLERIDMIKILAEIPGSKNLLIKSDNKVMGIGLSRPGRLLPFFGPVIAETSDVALQLIQNLLQYWNTSGSDKVFMDMPEHHLRNSIFTDSKHLSQNVESKITVNPARSFVRMYQLIVEDEFEKNQNWIDNHAIQKALEGAVETEAFMIKERNEIVPLMFGTAGPEWS